MSSAWRHILTQTLAMWASHSKRKSHAIPQEHQSSNWKDGKNDELRAERVNQKVNSIRLEGIESDLFLHFRL